MGVTRVHSSHFHVISMSISQAKHVFSFLSLSNVITSEIEVRTIPYRAQAILCSYELCLTGMTPREKKNDEKGKSCYLLRPRVTRVETGTH